VNVLKLIRDSFIMLMLKLDEFPDDLPWAANHSRGNTTTSSVATLAFVGTEIMPRFLKLLVESLLMEGVSTE